MTSEPDGSPSRPPRDWSLSEVVAQRIRRERLRKGLTREQLAEACQKLGAPAEGPRAISVHTLANVETGRPDSDGRRRRDITVDELVLFARALDVPPLALIYPVDADSGIDVTPGARVDAWSAAKWFSGEAPFPGAAGTESHEFNVWLPGAAPLDLLRRYERAYGELSLLTDGTGAAEDRAALEGELRHLRHEMRRLGLPLPLLPEELAHIDEPTTRRRPARRPRSGETE